MCLRLATYFDMDEIFLIYILLQCFEFIMRRALSTIQYKDLVNQISELRSKCTTLQWVFEGIHNTLKVLFNSTIKRTYMQLFKKRMIQWSVIYKFSLIQQCRFCILNTFSLILLFSCGQYIVKKLCIFVCRSLFFICLIVDFVTYIFVVSCSSCCLSSCTCGLLELLECNEIAKKIKS